MDAAEDRRPAVAAELASEPHLWWDHHANHGWVVLDRHDTRNQSDFRHLTRCRDWAPLEVSRAAFGSDRFIGFRTFLAALPHTRAQEACEQLLAFRRAFATLPRIIRFSARVRIKGGDGSPLDEAAARHFDGVTADCGLGACSSQLVEAGITGGRVKLTYDPTAGHFRATADYEAPGRLAQAELDRLKKETAGDWSDGVGASFFEYLGQRLGIAATVSWAWEEDLRIEQLIGRTSGAGQWADVAKAAWRADVEMARAALDRGEDVNARADGLPALQAAIAEGKAEVALLLIDRGADAHARDLLDEQRDALMECATTLRMGDLATARIARALLERGADSRVKADLIRALAVARRRGKADLIRVLEEFAGTVGG